MQVDAVIVAAGGSTRFGERNKILAPLCGVPALAWSLRAFAGAASVRRIVVVSRHEDRAEIESVCASLLKAERVPLVDGGARRRDSVEAGLRACSSRYVAIHDGARPLVSPALIERVIAAADGKPGAIAAARVVDTVKEVVDGTVVGHPDRSRLWTAQTPQVVRRQAWLDAAATSDNDETDDAAMLDRLGLDCVVVENEAPNLKITRPSDLTFAEAVLRERGDACG